MKIQTDSGSIVRVARIEDTVLLSPTSTMKDEEITKTIQYGRKYWTDNRTNELEFLAKTFKWSSADEWIVGRVIDALFEE